MSPMSASQQRQEAYQLCENFKEHSPHCAACGLQLAQKNNNPVIRHFGLQLLEHCAKFRWNSWQPPEKVQFKDTVLKMMAEGVENILTEQPYIKDALSKIVVELIKREWPQHWPTMMEELSRVAALGETQTELVLLIFLRLVEDIVAFQNLPTQRRKDILQCLTAHMGELFTFFTTTLQTHTMQYHQLARSLGEAEKVKAQCHCRVAQAVLKTLCGYVEWVSVSHVFANDGKLVESLCLLLGQREFQLHAAECLLLLVNRRGRTEERKPLLLLFNDGAMDTILSAARILKAYGIPEQIVHAIGSLYEGTMAKVVTPDGDTRPFEIQAGVLQGDTLAPYLFVLVLDYALRVAIEGREEELGFQLVKRRSRRIGPKVVTDLDFADDIALLSVELHQAQQLLRNVETSVARVGLQMNAGKTKFMAFNQQSPVCLKTTDGSTLEKVEDFKYLGSHMESTAKDINSRKAAAWRACNKMDKIWKSDLSSKLKTRLFLSTVESVLLYGCEAWTVTPKLEKQLDGCYTRMLRRVHNVHWEQHLTNKELYAGLPKLTTKIRARRLRFAGHTLRNCRKIASHLVLWSPAHGGRRPGRPPLTYPDVLRRDVGLRAEDMGSADREALQNEQHYLFLKRLCQLLVGLGQQLGTLWGPTGLGVGCPANFSKYLSAILSFTAHNSQSLSSLTQGLWAAFLRHEHISKDSVFLEFVPKVLQQATINVVKTGFPSLSNSPSCTYSQVDFDSDDEFNSFFAAFRAQIVETVRLCTGLMPKVAFHYTDQCIRQLMASPINSSDATATGQGYCNLTSPSFVRWDGLTCYMEAVVNKIVKLNAVQLVIPEGVSLLEDVLGYSPKDPLILSCVLTCVSTLFPFGLNTIDTILPIVLQKATMRSRGVQNVRRHACSALLRICRDSPDILLASFDLLYGYVKKLLAEEPSLTQMEKTSLSESLMLISNQFKNFDRQSAFIREMVAPVSAVWLSPTMKQVMSSPALFISSVGMDKPACPPGQNDPAQRDRQQHNSIFHVCRIVYASIFPLRSRTAPLEFPGADESKPYKRVEIFKFSRGASPDPPCVLWKKFVDVIQSNSEYET
ncbi:Exportin-5 [Branchiostoma belcheri]|nr:Exportin-5 [Branchiostoma belcheri]